MCDALTVDPSDARPRAGHDALERIAAVLGCPMAAFYTGEGAPLASTGVAELLTLWDRLKTDAGRQAVLKLVRAIAEHE